MCNCDDGWTVIIAGTPDAMPMGSGPVAARRRDAGDGLAARPDTRALDGQPAPVHLHRGRPAEQSLRAEAARPAARRPRRRPSRPASSARSRRSSAPSSACKLDKHTKALRKWRDKEYYDEWRFVAGDADNDVMQDPANKPPVFIPTPRR